MRYFFNSNCSDSLWTVTAISHLNQVVFPAPQTDLLCMLQAGLPLGFRRRIGEVVVMPVEAGICQVVAELASRQGRGGQTGIHAGLIQGQGIKGSKHADIGQNRSVILPVTVTVRRHIHHQGNMEVGPSVHHCLGVLCHLAVQNGVGIAVVKWDGVKVAGAQTAAAPHTVLLIHVHLFCVLIEYQAVVGTFPHTATAAPAQFLRDEGFSVGVLVCLSGPGAAAHTDILDGSAEAGHLVTLKMGKADKDICVHDGPADSCLGDVLSPLHGNADIVRAL